MKKLYRLCSFQFWGIGIKAFFVCAALLVFQLVAFSRQSFNNNKIRFEQFMQQAEYSTMFFIAFALILIIIAVSVYQRYFGSKSIYTIMSLPVNKVGIYLSFIIPGIIAILMLCFTQIISVYISYQIILQKAVLMTGHTSSIALILPKDVDYMDNALFLSFVRYDYLRLLLPLNLLDFARSICLIVSPVITVIYFAFCERSRKYEGMVLVIFQAILMWTIISNINNTLNSTIEFTIATISLSVILSLLCAFLTYRLIKNKEVV